MSKGRKRPYCRPLNAGLASETSAVCKRVGRLITALDTELTCWVVEGGVVDDIGAFRSRLMKRLEKEGWTLSYDGGNRMKVRHPGHKRPFKGYTPDPGDEDEAAD